MLNGDPAPPPPKGQSPQFAAHICCGQMAGWIKMALGTEVGLGPGHSVLDGNPAPLPKKGVQPLIFGPFLLSSNCWMHENATWYGDRPRPRPHYARWGPSSPMHKKRTEPPNFWPMSVVAKRLDGPRCHLVRRWASALATLC